ncbi:YigZ family protein [Hespellia stercorisuis]|uniref:Uncharacterized protein, YigZ family n=1 Tax=Hespellia stercorisuis DSM 15480 TaxID=1121950 RepID=A0A1M6QQQ9_9FIRM|nr:YigZ family protein [Hespellia stercorisuis]SHK22536.1 uncharacterized protein, YigZ family [Hespellia stercorisuis DSM 15480]
MLNSYQTIYRGGTGEIVEKKSRFIVTTFPVETEDEATAIIEKVKKQYWDARHNCWAYTVGVEQPLVRCSDDGEPSGTAGKPIMEVITGQELKNVLVIVTRYFGGTLLGTGGLVRAYTAAAKAGIDASVQVVKTFGYKLRVKTDYTGLGKIQYILGQRGLTILDSVYTDVVEVEVLVPAEDEERIVAEIVEGSNGKAEMEKGAECFFAKVDGEMVVF